MTTPSDRLLTTYAPPLPVDATGIVAHQAPDFFALWEALERERGVECEVPYWAAIWPGARLLAQYLLEHPEVVAKKTVLEFGAGGAVASIAALRSGAASAIANDIDDISLAIAARNGAKNGVSLLFDNRNLLGTPDIGAVDVVLVADMFYERSTADALYRFLCAQQDRGAVVFISDGGRAFTPKKAMTPVDSKRFIVNHPLEGCPERTATLYRLNAH
jgi:predicted nicotinamide N-methyase